MCKHRFPPPFISLSAHFPWLVLTLSPARINARTFQRNYCNEDNPRYLWYVRELQLPGSSDSKYSKGRASRERGEIHRRFGPAGMRIGPVIESNAECNADAAAKQEEARISDNRYNDEMMKLNNGNALLLWHWRFRNKRECQKNSQIR